MLRIGACNDTTGQLKDVAEACRKWTDRSSYALEFFRFHNIDELLFEREAHGHFDIVFIGTFSEAERVAESAVRLIGEDRYTVIVLMLCKTQLPGVLPVIHSFFFLYKPICKDAVESFLDSYIREYPRRKFVYRRGTFFHAVPSRDILYFVHDRRVVRMIRSDGGSDDFYMKLDLVEELLRDSVVPFLRIHESYLINYLRINSIGNDRVIMENGELLTISVKYRKQVANFVKEQLYIR